MASEYAPLRFSGLPRPAHQPILPGPAESSSDDNKAIAPGVPQRTKAPERTSATTVQQARHSALNRQAPEWIHAASPMSTDNRFVSNRLWRTGGIFLYPEPPQLALAVPLELRQVVPPPAALPQRLYHFPLVLPAMDLKPCAPAGCVSASPEPLEPQLSSTLD